MRLRTGKPLDIYLQQEECGGARRVIFVAGTAMLNVLIHDDARCTMHDDDDDDDDDILLTFL
jgi:hypothetical protein